MTIDPRDDKTHQAFLSAFFNTLVGAFTESSGSPWLIVAGPDEVAANDRPDPLRIRLKLEGSLQGEFLLEFDRAEASTLASIVLRRPAGESGVEDSEALLRLIRSGLSEFRSKLGLSYGSFTIDASSNSEPAPGPSVGAQITACDDQSNRVSIGMLLNTELANSLRVNFPHENHGEGTGKAMNEDELEVLPPPVNLDLVMDVELNVTLRFGRRQLTLREVLELTSGSVVELDRQVDEPVELLLDGLVIAKGEAVVIDGNYGFRVTDVVQPVHSQLVR